MSLEEITKEEWDLVFKESITLTEKQIVNLMDTYKNLLTLRSNYRTDYSTHRIIHKFDFDKGSITYKKGPKRKLGFQIPYKKGGDKNE